MMRRILAVDDNEDILEVIKMILEDYGYEVITLADGRKTLDTIDESHPDLVLLDVMLGNTDGRELCREIKSNKETSDLPVIMISASHNVQNSFALSGAPDDFLAKPFDISELLDKVQSRVVAA